MSRRLQGKRALITGGAQGLGFAFGNAFAAEGAKVVLTDLQQEKVENAAAEVGGVGLAHDVTDEVRWAEVVAEAKAAMGGIDILVHNAGIGSFGTVETETYEQYRQVMAVDCDSVFLGTKAAMPVLKESDSASIIVISSVAGMIAEANFLSYNTAKAAVAMMSKSIALHCAKSGYPVRCNSIHPVFTRTPILAPMIAMKGSYEEGEKALSRQIPMGRLGEPEEVAAMAVYLASDESCFVTGSAFTIDGGITARGATR